MLEVNSANFEKEVLESSLPVIVDLHAAWCGPCRAIAPVFETLSKEYEGKVRFVKLDVEASPDIADTYHVNSIPCFMVFKGGKNIAGAVGAMSVASLKELANQAL